jgi:hypothetical protein
MEDNLFLTCFSGLSRKLREGDLEGVPCPSVSETVASVGLETEIPFLGDVSCPKSPRAKSGRADTDADLAWLTVLVVLSGIKGALCGEFGRPSCCRCLGNTKSVPLTVSLL